MASTPPSPLKDAVSSGDLETVEQMLASQSSTLDDAAFQDLLKAASWGPNDSVFLLLLAKHSPRSIPEEVVLGTVYSGSTERFQALLDRDSSLVNLQFDRRGTPLVIACSSRQSVEFLKFLLGAGADPNQDPEAAALPLACVAAFYQDTSAADLLLKHGAKMKGSGALETAASRGNEVMVRYFLEHGADRETDSAGISAGVVALCGATRCGRPKVVKALLEHGIDSKSKNADGKTALDILEEVERKQSSQETAEVKELLSSV